MDLPELQCNALICRYNEIATKGRNRSEFERLLADNIRFALRDLGKLRILRERGRLFVRRAGPVSEFSPADRALIRERIPRIPGLASVSPGQLVAPELAAIEHAVLETFPAVYACYAERIPEPERIAYCMRARRSDKSFPLSSHDLEVAFAEKFLTQYPRLRVDLTQPQLRIDVEIRAERAFISYESIPGPGGLPVGSAGRVLALLSGGIDSPVACYQMMKRGCKLDFVTFHSAPYTPPALIAKVATLVRLLNRYQRGGRLFAVNLLEAQKQIRDRCQSRYRTVLYRRLMVRISTLIARMLRAGALATGDNLGQVASQTLDNMAVISAACPMLILRPLLTFDKFETMALARELGTLDTSQQELPDSCTVFAPPRPATSATAEHIQAEEAKLDLEQLLVACLRGTREIDVTSAEQRVVPKLDATTVVDLPRDVLANSATPLHVTQAPGTHPTHPTGTRGPDAEV